MKVAVVGAGAVGCYFGGLLARSGTEVTLIGRPAHVEAIAARGLLLEIGGQCQAVPMPATADPAALAGAELVLVCVKSGASGAAGREIAPHLRPDAAVLSLQNGVDNAARLQEATGRPVVPVAVYVATTMAGPGHVRHHGRGELVMGPSPRQEEIVACFAAAGVPVQVSADAIGALWAKLVTNCAYNALSALTRLPYRPMLASEGIEAVMRDVVAECEAVAEAAGVALPADILASVLGLAATMPDQTSSTAQDLAAGKATEIDHLNGFVLRKGAELGVATPVNRVLHSLVKAVEGRSCAHGIGGAPPLQATPPKA